MDKFYEKMHELMLARHPFVAVTVVDAAGSAPADPGAKMLVTATGLHFGTIGGGTVENMAIAEAQKLLASEKSDLRTRFVNWSLDQDIGMTCGGLVKLYFERHDFRKWDIVIFGAGHVGIALASLLLKLDCHVTCIDPRADWLEKLPVAASLKKVHVDDMKTFVPEIPEGAFVVIMTMGHLTDKPILLQILKTRKLPYVGVIGSASKAAGMRKELLEDGIAEEVVSSFFCPIGLPLGSNQPEEIALSIAAQLVQERDRIQAKK